MNAGMKVVDVIDRLEKAMAQTHDAEERARLQEAKDQVERSTKALVLKLMETEG